MRGFAQPMRLPLRSELISPSRIYVQFTLLSLFIFFFFLSLLILI